MTAQPTPVRAPRTLEIADDIRLKIERGELRPGDTLPTLKELCEQWDCSTNVARGAVELLKNQGLITVARGKAGTVREPRKRAVRSSLRHQAEKDLVRLSVDERRKVGLSETDLRTPIDHLTFHVTYDQMEAGDELARVFGVPPAAKVLKRVYELREPRTERRRAWSVSYIPTAQIEANVDLFDSSKEPWPGGTQHQLYTVGIEIARIIDEVSAFMPSTADASLWDLERGVPMLRVRRISISTTGEVVEVSDADYAADRTDLSFITDLDLW